VIEVRVDDLAFFQGSALLRPVNAELGATTSLLRRLEVAAGPALANQLRVQEPMPVGSAVVSGAGDLPVELIVHAVVCSKTEPVSRDSVRRALSNALQRTVDWELESVGIAPFGLGAGNLDIEESAEVMAEVIARHVSRARYPARICFVAESAEEEWALTRALQRTRA
jgi:O-acetyl-ADP-ribose deacetylase (regulator of RNase III)